MISQIRKVESGLRLHGLALLLQLIAVILISMAFLLIVRDNFLRTRSIFEKSNTVIFEAETSNQLGYSLQLYQVSMSQAINSNSHTLVILQDLYRLIRKNQEYIHPPTYSQTDDCYKVQYCPRFGFQSKSPLKPVEYEQIWNFTRLLNEYVFEFTIFNDRMSFISYFDYGTEELYLQYPSPQGEIAESFKTDQYLNDFKSSNQRNQLLLPFFNTEGGQIYFIIFSQFILEYKVKGALRYDQMLNLTQFPNFYNLIADENWNIHTFFGVLNYTSRQPIIPDPKFPERNITFEDLSGFSYQDWATIMIQNQSLVYNSFLEKKVFAKKSKFSNSDALLVVYQDVSSYLIQQAQIMTKLYNFETEVFQRLYITILICIYVFGLFQVMIIIKILQPLTKLTLMVQNQIYSITKNDIRTSFFEQLEFRKLEANSSLNQLYQAIIRQKKRSSEEKSDLCSIYQGFIYPRKVRELLKLKLENVPNYEPRPIEIIFKLFENTNF